MVEIIRAENYEELGQIAGEQILRQVEEKRDSVLGLATGGTPRGIYRYLAEKKPDLSRVRTVNLDEYLGLSGGDPRSYHYYMKEYVWEPLEIGRENRLIPDGLCQDAEEECRRYEEQIRALGGIDLQLLGLGENGHIGFNEPGPAFVCDTHKVCLSPETRAANSRFFGSPEEVPRYALTMGIRTIMRARRILLVVSGGKKAKALQAIMGGGVTPQIPVTILLLHPRVTVAADAAALGGKF